MATTPAPRQTDAESALAAVPAGAAAHLVAEASARESELRFRAAFENAAIGASIVDISGTFLRVNRFLCHITGYTEEELLSRAFSDLTHPDDVWIGLDYLKRQIAGELEFASFEKRYLRKNGEVLHLIISPTIVRDASGTPAYFIGLFQDVTERRRTERLLRDSEARYHTLFDSSTDNVFLLELNGRFIDANRTAYERLGYTREEFLAMDIKALADPAFADRVPARVMQLHEHGVAVFESGHRRKDGTTMPVEVNSRILDFEGRKVFLSQIRDITERKEAEENLRQSEELVRSILDSVDVGFLLIDRNFHILTANKAFCAQVGLPCGDLFGKPCSEISRLAHRPCDQQGAECPGRRVFETGTPHTLIQKFVDAQGTLVTLETKAFPVRDASGAVSAAIETVSNITEKLQLEEERLKTQKLEAIGTLAGGIAHDFNNLLQGVFGHISLAKMEVEPGAQAFELLTQAEQALHLSVNLTTQLLTFSKGGKPLRKHAALRPVIENSVRFALSGSRTGYRITIAEDLWPAEVDEGQIAQVLQNIVLNADQAMEPGGTVEIDTTNVVAPAAALPPGLNPGRYVAIAIRDRGHGIAPLQLARIFEPYFTTKERGSGLGLATSYSIVNNHGGLIEVASDPGRGSCFSVYLPAAEGAVATVEPAPVPAAGRAGKLLVMDDDKMVRAVAGRLLKALGHRADFAEHGREAVEKYRTARGAGVPYDAVILDLTIREGLGGRETLEQLRAIDPEVRAIVSSGYSDDAVMADHLAFGFRGRLSKPYRLDQLREALGALLG